MSAKNTGGGWTDKTLDERERIVASLRRFYSAGEAERWMRLPHSGLGGRSPNGLVATGQEDEVWAEIDRLSSASFV
jgi:uncharacterized protein (DUF2384 family)